MYRGRCSVNNQRIIIDNFKIYSNFMATKRTQTKATRPKPMSPKAGVKKNRYDKGGTVKKK